MNPRVMGAVKPNKDLINNPSLLLTQPSIISPISTPIIRLPISLFKDKWGFLIQPLHLKIKSKEL
jgi:hypothetical protein